MKIEGCGCPLTKHHKISISWQVNLSVHASVCQFISSVSAERLGTGEKSILVTHTHIPFVCAWWCKPSLHLNGYTRLQNNQFYVKEIQEWPEKEFGKRNTKFIKSVIVHSGVRHEQTVCSGLINQKSLQTRKKRRKEIICCCSK